MSKKARKTKRRCPGDMYDISISVCRGRKRVHYPKCSECHYNNAEIFAASSESEEENDAEAINKGNNKPRKIVELYSTRDKLISLKIFKSYDIRGVYSEELDEYTSEKIGMATALFLKSAKGGIKNIVVARDVRPSSNSLAQSLIKGIIKAGIDVVDIGEVATDVTYFAVGNYDYDAGIMVTASHNPSKYNGFKICRENAIPISFDTGLSEIAEIASQTKLPASEQPGRIIEKNVLDDYKRYVLRFANNIRPLRVVIDAGNGMAGKMIPIVFAGLPCELVPLFFNLDGAFPNHEPNPLEKKNLRDLREKVRETKSHLGVAFDGDADRCVFVDENGYVVGCDLITAIIAKELLQREKGSTIVYDLRSSWVVSEEIKKVGGNPYREMVGHSHIKATMREKNAVFGGELSGHYYFKEYYYADSGVIALIEVLNVLSHRNVPMSNLVSPLRRYYATGEINFEVEDKDGKIKQIAEHFKDGKVDYLDGITVEYKDWWFNVRKSNTEPLLRLNLEGRTREIMEHGKKLVIDIIREE